MAARAHITTAITYSNAAPHVGHAYEYLATDTYVRHLRRKLGKSNVTFVTGTDEHGDKNLKAATAAGLAPKAFADKISAIFRATHAGLNISYDFFVRTTDPVHEKFVQKMLARAHQRGEIYFKDYEGLYCVGCQLFLTEKELLPGNICPTHNTPVELIKEKNYFLKLEAHRAEIRAHIERTPDFIRPDRYRNEALNMLAEPIEDLCISRPKARLDWGIDLPFDTNYVTYVWYDAFWAYVSELPDTSDAALDEILPVTEHFIGKDILKTHAVYWPAMLIVSGLPLYKSLNVHGWMNFRGARFSKTSGNVADPLEYEKTYGPDVLRYFVLRDAVYGLDVDFSDEKLVERYNADLANDLGNLTSRVLAMAARYFNGDVTADPAWPEDVDLRFYALGSFDSLQGTVSDAVDHLAFQLALREIWLALGAANRYIVETQPFALAKDPTKMPRVAQILANLLEVLRVVGDTLEPFMPVTSRKMLDLLSVVDEATARAPFGHGIKRGHRVKPPVALFPRIEKTDKPARL
jgi:methionyl-tRNA synthetase